MRYRFRPIPVDPPSLLLFYTPYSTSLPTSCELHIIKTQSNIYIQRSTSSRKAILKGGKLDFRAPFDRARILHSLRLGRIRVKEELLRADFLGLGELFLVTAIACV